MDFIQYNSPIVHSKERTGADRKTRRLSEIWFLCYIEIILDREDIVYRNNEIKLSQEFWKQQAGKESMSCWLREGMGNTAVILYCGFNRIHTRIEKIR